VLIPSSCELLREFLEAATRIWSAAMEAKVKADILVELFEKAATYSERIQCRHDCDSDYAHRSLMDPTDVEFASQSLAICLKALEEEINWFLKLVANIQYAKWRVRGTYVFFRAPMNKNAINCVDLHLFAV
jgi:hypothetical protein